MTPYSNNPDIKGPVPQPLPSISLKTQGPREGVSDSEVHGGSCVPGRNVSRKCPSNRKYPILECSKSKAIKILLAKVIGSCVRPVEMFNSKCGCHPEADSLLIITVVRPRGFLSCNLEYLRCPLNPREEIIVMLPNNWCQKRKVMPAFRNESKHGKPEK